MKFLFLLSITLLFFGCNPTQTPKELEAQRLQEKKAFQEKIAQSKEIQIKKIEAQTKTELAKIEGQKELAKIDKAQLLQKLRLEMELEKERVNLQEKKERFLLEKRVLEQKVADEMEMRRYILLLVAFVISIVALFLFLYFKKRHEDKLQAYRDNLEKYFHQQESMTRIRIAEKIIDSVASGKLDKEQERELIGTLGGSPQKSETIELIEEGK